MTLKHLVKRLLYLFFPKFRRRKTRRYISRRMGIEGFFRLLQSLDVTYCVLRWFERLPELEPGEDIDLLVADADVSRLLKYFTPQPGDGNIPCDLYSVSGLRGTAFSGIAYYPKKMAERILDTARLQSGLYRVPDPAMHFWSLAYHALYHKGYGSDLPADGENHDSHLSSTGRRYVTALATAARQAGIELPGISLRSLDELLERNGFKPPRDVLEKLSPGNKWIGDLLRRSSVSLPGYYHGLAAFVIRERGLPFIRDISEILFIEGFNIIGVYPIKDAQKDIAREHMRGGNWSRGPFPTSGGPPMAVLAACDSCPLIPSPDTVIRHPGLTNQRVLNAKNKVRKFVNATFEKKTRCNILHSSDNPHQAIDYIMTAIPAQFDFITARLKKYDEDFRTPFPVIENLSLTARRAKVELVDYHGEKAVCKTFKAGRERFLGRELEARRLCHEKGIAAELLETGPHYLVMRYYPHSIHEPPNGRRHHFQRRRIQFGIYQAVKDVIRFFQGEGYEYIDFNPGSIRLDGDRRIKLIDFEFLQRRKGPIRFSDNYTWHPIPRPFDGDLPPGVNLSRNPYYTTWFECIGLPRSIAVRDLSPSVFWVWRALFLFAAMAWHAGRSAGKRLIRFIQNH